MRNHWMVLKDQIWVSHGLSEHLLFHPLIHPASPNIGRLARLVGDPESLERYQNFRHWSSKCSSEKKSLRSSYIQQIIQLYSCLGSKPDSPDIIPFQGWNAWDGREGQLCSQHSWWHTCFISLPKCVHCPGVSSWIIICQSANIRYITSSWPRSTKSTCFVSF